tara:strand:+ start:4821 stop:5153 length:333 start_codon:yes stop_codon:yes gene_type:complete
MMDVLEPRVLAAESKRDDQGGYVFLQVHDAINHADYALSERLRQRAIRDAEWRKRMRALNMNTSLILDLSSSLLVGAPNQSQVTKGLQLIEDSAKIIQELTLGLARIESE